MAPHSEESITKATDQAMQKTYENYDTYLKLPSEIGTDYNFKHKVVWFNAIGFLVLHLAALYGIYLCFFTTLLSTLYSKYGVTSAQTGLETSESVSLRAAAEPTYSFYRQILRKSDFAGR